MPSGVIVGFRRGPKTMNPGQALIRLDGYRGREVLGLIGRSVRYRDRHGNVYLGKVIRHHGWNGVVRVRFEPNLPPQAIGDRVEVIGPEEGEA